MSDNLALLSFKTRFKLIPSSSSSQQHKTPGSTSHPHQFQSITPAMSMSSRSTSVSSKASKGSKKSELSKQTIQQMLQTLSTHRINTLTELCRIERTAASCEDEEDARAFQQPMTAAWNHYVTSNQLLTELRGLTVNYPISSDILQDAQIRVRNDPQSNRSWNMAWLCLTRIRDDGLIVFYASLEAARPEMWGDMTPSADDLRQLATCFEREWVRAVDRMLQHWMTPPAWY